MKKICAISTVTITQNAFIKPAMYELKKQGFDVTLACSMDDKFIESSGDFKCADIPMKRGIDLFGSIKAIVAFYKLFKNEKFDCIQYATPNASLYASIAGRLARVPVRMYCQWGIRYVGLEGFSRKIFKAIEKITISNSTTVRAVSPKNRQFVIDEGIVNPEKIKVLGIGGTIGVDLDEYPLDKKEDLSAEIREKYKIPKDAFIFGFVGRINRDKGVNELITAFKNFDNNDVYLMLVGAQDSGNPIDSDLLEYATNCKNIVLTGMVPSNEVPQYLAAFNVLVHPTYREGFGKVIQEAMAMKVPVITTDIPGPSEVIEEGISGMLVPVKDSDVLFAAMNSIMHNESLIESFADAGRTRAEKYFARPKMIKDIVDDYKEILGIKEESHDEAYALNR